VVEGDVCVFEYEWVCEKGRGNVCAVSRTGVVREDSSMQEVGTEETCQPVMHRAKTGREDGG
jgi:hypothetical protein